MIRAHRDGKPRARWVHELDRSQQLVRIPVDVQTSAPQTPEEVGDQSNAAQSNGGVAVGIAHSRHLADVRP